MEKHAVRIPHMIPLLDWSTNGTWQDTLREELLALPADTLTMCIKSVSAINQVGYPYVFGLHGHSRGGLWEPIAKLPGYEYCWETIDGRTLDELNIFGPFDATLLSQIIERFEAKGLKLDDRWSLLVTFGT